MTKDESGKPVPGAPIAKNPPISKDPKGAALPHPGHPVPHGGGEGATGMQPGAGHPRGR
jgi:hypothetical protein